MGMKTNSRDRNSVWRTLLVAVPLSATALLAAAAVTFNAAGCTQGSGERIGGAIGQVAGVDADTQRRLEVAGRAGETAARTQTLTERQEEALGESVALRVTSEHGLSDDEALNRYVTLVGLTLASATNRPDGNWLFGVLDSDEVNAYAGPGGFIMVTRGALRQMQNEAELAGVLAHEIGHVLRHHGLEAVKAAGKTEILAEVGKEAMTSLDARLGQFHDLSDTAANVVLNTGYSRPQEFQADEVAVRLMARAGYDPRAYARLLQRLRAGPEGGGEALMSTHPGSAERAERVASQIRRDFPNAGGATLAERFAANVRQGEGGE